MTSDPAGLTVDQLLTTTRTVRRRLDLTRPVPVPVVEECLRVAQQAPCGSGRHIPHWIVVTDPAVRSAIGELYRSGFEEGAGPARAPADPVRRRTLASARYLAGQLGQVPVLVVACLEVGGPLPPGNQAGVWGSLLPAVWSFMLAARRRGLGTAWTTAHLRHERRLGRLLGIPDGVHQAALIPTAYYRGETFRPAARPPLATVLHHDRW